MGIAPIERDFTVDLGGETFGVIELGTATVDRDIGIPEIHRTWLVAGPLGAGELPVGAVATLFIAAIIAINLVFGL